MSIRLIILHSLSVGNGIGMKIVGGKAIPGTDGEVGAYVATIYPGGVADQLHGELQEGTCWKCKNETIGLFQNVFTLDFRHFQHSITV